jgi:PTS system nitrogen regulatory IIA component
MKLSEIFKPQLIISDLKAHDKKGVLEELSQIITEQNPSLNKRSLLQVLLERERLGSSPGSFRKRKAWKYWNR